ncbi:hypothetical protein KKF29_00115, partial [Patescibacteria group bacterium]|nr:hypothetical protein [Patescibacteria group bacterium]
DSGKAYYAAESGLEKSLYTLKINREQRAGLANTVNEILGFQNELLKNNSKWSINSVTDSEDSVSTPLAQLNSMEVNYYNPDDYATSIITGSSQLEVTWIETSACAAPTDVEITVNKWHAGYWPEDPDKEDIVEKFLASGGSYTRALDSGWFYQVRARPMDCDLDEITITAIDTTSSQPKVVPIYGELTITSIGESGRSKQALVAKTTWQVPIYSLYDFALFSECDIVKESSPKVNCP